MHHIYKTQAIVINSQPIKEADKQLVLLTEDFGLIKAIAQGTRKVESKLRPSIQDFSVTEVALVKGRVGWRLTNARIDYSISAQIENQKLFRVISRTFSLIERFVLGESEDFLFEMVLKYIKFAQQNQNQILHEDQINNFETLFVYEILKSLGYIGEESKKQKIPTEINLENINLIDSEQRKELNKIINQAIRQSGL